MHTQHRNVSSVPHLIVAVEALLAHYHTDGLGRTLRVRLPGSHTVHHPLAQGRGLGLLTRKDRCGLRVHRVLNIGDEGTREHEHTIGAGSSGRCRSHTAR